MVNDAGSLQARQDSRADEWFENTQFGVIEIYIFQTTRGCQREIDCRFGHNFELAEKIRIKDVTFGAIVKAFEYIS